MTGIDGYNWGSVGWSNPIPGDPDVVRGIGGQFADLADEASQQNSLLQSVGSDASGVWKGGAADAFHPTVAKLPGQLDKLVTSYREAGNALNTFWPKHRAAQQLAVQALAKAQAAQSAITHD
ncbi:MAG TPA: WXG100 family type VII secretion target, partial [Acidimicrobiales bacterium]|nr:WXG100 family type VII secretion target [Acidimicrobiales bacterium]